MTDRKRCESCGQYWPEIHLCYCEDCDEVACLECTLEQHVKNPLHKKPSSAVYLSNLERPVLNDDADICGNELCQHYAKDHDYHGGQGQVGDDSCSICETRIGPSTAKDVARDLRCPQFVDQSQWTDEQKFWKSFDSVTAMSSKSAPAGGGSQSKSTVIAEGQVLVTADIFTLQIVCKSRWGWKPEKTLSMVSALDEAGAAKVIKRVFFERDSSRSQNAVARIPQVNS